MTTDTITTDIATLPPTERALIVLGSTKTERDLHELVAKAQAITDVTNADGREQAHRMGMSLKKARTTIGKTGKAARDDATAFCKAVISEEKRLIAITEGEEQRVIGLRDAFDEKLEAERRAAEAKRAEIRRKIDDIRALPMAMAGAGSDEIAAERDALQSFVPTADVFDDMTEDCAAAIAEAVAALSDMHARVMAQEVAAAAQEAACRQAEAALAAERAAIEAERAALAAERAELEALRAAAAAQAGAVSEPAPVVDEPVPETEQLFDEEPPVEAAPIEAPATDWRIRQFAMHTAGQFEAMAHKVSQCGFATFAGDLRLVAEALRTGAHDGALAKADHEALVAADNLLLDATVEAIDVLRDTMQEAA